MTCFQQSDLKINFRRLSGILNHCGLIHEKRTRGCQKKILLNYVTYPDFWLHFIAMQFYGYNNSLQLSNSHTPGLKLNCHIFTDARTSTILQLKHQTMSNSLVRLTQTDFATRALKVYQALEFPAGETLFIKSNFTQF